MALTTIAHFDTLQCGAARLPADTEVVARFVTGDGMNFQRLPDGAGAALYLEEPIADGPWEVTGP